MKTLRRFLHADCLRRADGKENYGLRRFHEQGGASSVIVSEAAEWSCIALRFHQRIFRLRLPEEPLQATVTSSQKPPPRPTPHRVASVRILARDPNTFSPGDRPEKIQGNEKTEFWPP